MLVPVAVLATLWGQAAVVVAQPRTTLDIYVVDVEGGNAVLFSAPTGESLLIDSGNVAPDAAIRDAERIMAAAKDARHSQIDNLITTHWHGDHFGGMGTRQAHPDPAFHRPWPDHPTYSCLRRISDKDIPAALRQG
jgi:glyoxylase-like metal-dependent hydrolase (beta-lactamase superfamily II)